jgi:hypothetical protein
VDSLAPLRFAIAANLAGRIHGELNGVQPDAGASALFAAQKFAAQQSAAQAAPAFDAPNPQTDRWEPAAQQVNTGAYPAYRPAPEPEYAGSQYAAGSELDYGSSRGYDSGAYTTAPVAPAGAHAAPTPAVAGYGGQGGQSGQAAYDYLDNSHTADSGQFSQYIADQYNTGQVAAVDYSTSAPAQPRPHQGGRWSYA